MRLMLSAEISTLGLTWFPSTVKRNTILCSVISRSGSGREVTSATENGPGETGLSWNRIIGSPDSHQIGVLEGAELFKYSALLPCHHVGTPKNSSVRGKHPTVWTPMLPQETLLQVAPLVGKVSLAIVTNGSSLHRRLGRTRRLIATTKGLT